MTKKNNLNKKDLLNKFKLMLLIRRFEEKAGQLYGMGLIGGFCHLYIGQEAVVTGVLSNLNKDDSSVTSYRDHAQMLACGLSPKKIMAELTGRSDGLSGGKGGSMHMFSKEKNFYGGHGIVGAQVPIGTGIAFSDKYNDKKNVTVVYVGDGAINQGQVYESFNMASLWNLPVLYVIENNKYAMGTSTARHSASGDVLYKRGEAYDIKGKRVNGMDVLEVEDISKKAIEHCRSGKGPYILEMMTYRYRGHSMSDPAKYRSKEEVADIKKNSDPINLIKDIIYSGNYANENELKEIELKIKKIVNEAAEFAKNNPEPNSEELWTDVLI